MMTLVIVAVAAVKRTQMTTVVIRGSNDNGDSGSKDDGGDDENSDDSSGDNDSSDSNSGGVPEDYLGEYSTCVTDLSTDDSILSQDDVVDCYGQVFGPNPTHELRSIDAE